MKEGPLTGITVLDLTRLVAGPFATQMLGDLGATIVKVERPEGDDSRLWGPPFFGPEDARESAYFMSMNRSKKSIVLDFKKPADLEVLRRMVRVSDVFIENFRFGTMNRLGLGPEALLKINPRLVVVSITGFGPDGPDADRPAFDQILQGESGLMSVTGEDHPLKHGLPISDVMTGMFAAFGALAGLRQRDRTGKGEIVHASLLAAGVAIQGFYGARYLMAGELTPLAGNGHTAVAPYGTFETSDGLLQIAVANEPIWRRFAPLVGLTADDPKFKTNAERMARQEELMGLVGKRLKTESVAHWLKLFFDNGIPAGEIKRFDQVYDWAQTISQGLIAEMEHPTAGHLRLPGPPLRFERAGPYQYEAPPRLGEHTDEVLAWLESREASAT